MVWPLLSGLSAATCIVVSTVALGAEQHRPDDSLAIGLLLPPDAVEAASLRQGASLGVEMANRSSGPKVRLVLRGRPGQWGTEGGEAAALALDEGVAGIVTPSAGTAAHEILQVSGRTRVPVISLCPDSSVTAAGVPWVVRILPRTEVARWSRVVSGITNRFGASFER